MNRRMPAFLCVSGLAVLLAGLSGLPAIAQNPQSSQVPVISWQGRDLAGRPVAVPHAQRISIVVFARSEQPRSLQALAEVARQAGQADDVQLVAVVSGPDAAASAARLAKASPWPGVFAVDPDYRASGAMSVRVWPTTVMVGKDGRQVAHLGGLTSSFAGELQAHLAYARGQIDQAQLRQRLQNHSVVASTDKQVAARHHEVARRLISQGQYEQAREELNRALSVQAGQPALLVELARVQVIMGQPVEALRTLDRVEPGAVPMWQVAGVRARALMAMEKWDQARAVLEPTLKLNPEPAEAYYTLGRIWARQGQWDKAAACYRSAFEHTRDARLLGISAGGRQGSP